MELLLSQVMPIPSHALAAMAAVVLGGAQLASAKGTATARHRALGCARGGLMTYVATSSFFISELKLWGGAFSPIHLLSIWTLFSLVMAARQGNIRLHKIWMVLLYILALKVTDVFTLLPGRVMHGVLFGV